MPSQKSNTFYSNLILSCEYMILVSLFAILWITPHKTDTELFNFVTVVCGLFLCFLTIGIVWKHYSDKLRTFKTRLAFSFFWAILEGFYTTLCLLEYNTFVIYFFYTVFLCTNYLYVIFSSRSKNNEMDNLDHIVVEE